MGKPIHFSQHALQQMLERGAEESEVEETIRSGENVPVKKERQGFRKNFQFNHDWGGHHYAVKQVLAIVAEEPEALVVVTVFTFYF